MAGTAAKADAAVKEIYKLRFGMDWDNDYYVEDIHCSNCNNKEQLMILKGHTKPSHINIDCIQCGCTTLVMGRY